MSPSDAGREDNALVDGVLMDDARLDGPLVDPVPAGSVSVEVVLAAFALGEVVVVDGVTASDAVVNTVLGNEGLANDRGRAGATLEMPLMDYLTNTWWDPNPVSPALMNESARRSLKMHQFL